MALKDQILSFDDRTKEPVDVPEWGSPKIFLRVISAAAREAVDDALTTVDKDGTIRFNRIGADARLLVQCLVDEDGERIFTDADVDALGEKSSAVLARLAEKARELNSVGLDDEKVVEEGKDSGQDQSSSSTTS
jgi:hypothetical protein